MRPLLTQYYVIHLHLPCLDLYIRFYLIYISIVLFTSTLCFFFRFPDKCKVWCDKKAHCDRTDRFLKMKYQASNQYNAKFTY